MRLFTFILITIASATAFAAGPQCSALFAPKIRNSLPGRVRSIRKRILELRQLEPPPNPSWERDRWRVSDRDKAERIFNYILKRGDPVDLEIFDTILKTVELTRGYHNVKGLDPGADYVPSPRPRTYLLQEEHWNFSNLTNYFFTGAPKLSVSKQRDLDYVKTVLTVAQEQTDQPIDRVLTEADLRWHAKALALEPEIAGEFAKWKGNSSLRSLKKKVLDEIPRKDEAAIFVKNARSYLDLYIVHRYFSLMRRLSVTKASDELQALQMTQWRALTEGLAAGDLNYLADFLLETSHDSARKIFLLRVLDEMDRGSSTPAFSSAYRDAIERVEQRTPDRPPPEPYQSDLHVFGVNGEEGLRLILNPGNIRIPRGLLEDPHAVHVRASWNRKLGELDVNVEKSVRLKDGDTSLFDVMPEMAPVVREYFVQLGRKGAVTQDQLKRQEARELMSMALRTTFIVATVPGKFSTDAVLGMGRIFYGGPRSLRFNDSSEIAPVGGEKTYIELDYPKYVLPARASGEDPYEFGRLWTTKLAAPNSRFGILSFMADVLQNSGARGTAYMDAGAASARMYELMGAKVVAGPKELGVPEGYNPIWALSAPISKIREDYLRDEFEALKLREPTKPE